MVDVETKVCTRCNEPKELSNFSKQSKGKFGLKSVCKVCDKEYKKQNNQSISEQNKKYYQANREKKIEYSKQYYEYNIDKVKRYKKEYRKLNSEFIKEQQKQWRESNKDKIKKDSKQHYEYNKDKRKKQVKQYASNRRKIDCLFRLRCNIRSLITHSISNRGFKKTSKTAQILGCSFEEFKLYLESKFEPWMNWHNYGKYNGELNYGWDIDHIIPNSSAITEDELIRLNHYTNLQPLCSKINREIKRQNYEKKQ